MNDTLESSGPGDAVRGRRVAGLVLLIVGATALAARYVTFDLGQSAPLLLGLIFLSWALLARSCGLLIPGGILTGLGAGLMLRDNFGGAGTFLLCFAGGWVLISLLSLLAFRRAMWWPLIPAAAIAFGGLTQLAGPQVRDWLQAAKGYWPVALIVVAVYLLLTKPRAKV